MIEEMCFRKINKATINRINQNWGQLEIDELKRKRQRNKEMMNTYKKA